MNFLGDSSTDLFFKTTFRTLKVSTPAVVLKGEKGDSGNLSGNLMTGISMTIDPNEAIQDKLEISAWDEDKIMDEIIGSILPLQTKDLIALGEKEGGTFFWQEIFGSPHGLSGKNCDKMNKHPKLASTWKGEVLIHV